ncbi:hypothetical protein [Methanosphaera sp. WGK6]|uniref:hypothetical protein n=1 Tax=Methanosphaera sp. WGK6 TaxID=1561964 RepID=UPI00084C2137|nr:hypothetical protein [Methanosphaera sp. WGK6]OED29666.1 hypothetical protein NL43_07040 [Methanosphaera sp. WGK6]
MLKIEHTICPACSVGCGLNIISKNDVVVGINSYKNHKINEGKNCNNCTKFIDLFKNERKYINNYSKIIQNTVNLLKSKENNKISLLISGNLNNEEIDTVIEFSKKQDYNILAYEYNFTNINSDIIATYDEIENATTIITVGDIYRNNPLISRKIIQAKKNGCYTINIHNEKNLTAYNSDEFISIISYSKVINVLNSRKLTEDTIIIINTIDSPDIYEEIVECVYEKNIKILPILKHPNSYSLIKKVTPSTIKELTNQIKKSEIVMLINENPLKYLSSDILDNKKIISLNTIQNEINSSEIFIPVKAWYELNGSFTNSEGLTQEFIDTIQNKKTSLKSITEVIHEINDGLMGD